MIALLDANALLALGWPNHEHHEVVIQYLGAYMSDGWATCSVTQNAFLRLSLNPRVVHTTLSSAQVVGYLRTLLLQEGHTFLEDDLSLVTVDWIPWDELRGYRQVTDLHLMALAVRHRARFVTLDSGIKSWAPEPVRSHLLVLGSPEN